jgi:prepilin-type N-terminal cleavage/methylation domain-containing protein
MSEDGYSILELLLALAILLIISGLGAWKFMQALQAINDLLALLK